MTDYLSLAKDLEYAVRQASTLVLKDFQAACVQGHIAVDHKDSTTALPDFVTATDTAAENLIHDILTKKYADISFVGEERGGTIKDERQFLIDPVDGTSNLASLRDYFAVCAACTENGEVIAAAIADPCRGKVVYSAKDTGAFMNGTKLVMNPALDDDLRQTQLECEVSFANANDLTRLPYIVRAMSGLRKSGSTALDLMNLACGRKIICWADNLKPHDLAAGLLIAKEAGFVVTDPHGQPAQYKSPQIVAGAPKNHARFIQLLQRP